MTAAESQTHVVSMVFGAMAADVLYAAAKLGLADAIGDGRRSAAELARDTGTDPLSLTRLLRAMAALGLLDEGRYDRFALTETGALLRSDHPYSLRSFVTTFGDPIMRAAWRDLDEAVRTGERPFDRIFGTSFFAHLAGRPQLSAEFNAAMRQGTAATAHQLPQAYDFTAFTTVADLGGGDGTLLAAVLAANPQLRGILFDTAHGSAQAAAVFGDAGLTERCDIQVGDFFASAPPGADLYVLKSVLHDWDDERCATILRLVRRVVPDHGGLLIIEPVLPPIVDGSVPARTYLSDLNMMVNVGGRERTQADFADLCRRSGFELQSVNRLPAPSGFSLIEARPGAEAQP